MRAKPWLQTTMIRTIMKNKQIIDGVNIFLVQTNLTKRMRNPSSIIWVQMQVETTWHGHRNHQHMAWSAYVRFKLGTVWCSLRIPDSYAYEVWLCGHQWLMVMATHYDSQWWINKNLLNRLKMFTNPIRGGLITFRKHPLEASAVASINAAGPM